MINIDVFLVIGKGPYAYSVTLYGEPFKTIASADHTLIRQNSWPRVLQIQMYFSCQVRIGLRLMRGRVCVIAAV